MVQRVPGFHISKEKIDSYIAHIKKYPPYTDEEFPSGILDGDEFFDENRIASNRKIALLEAAGEDVEALLAAADKD